MINKKKLTIRTIILTIIIITTITILGIYDKYKDKLILSAMETRAFSKIVKLVYSEDDIDRIIQNQQNEQQDTEYETIEHHINKEFNWDSTQKNYNRELYERYNIPNYLHDKIELYEKPIVELEAIKGKHWNGYILKINDPSRLHVGYSSKLGKQGEYLSDILKNVNSQTGFNGGGFIDPKWKSNGGKPVGIVISKGKIVYDNNLEKYELIGLTEDNTLVAGEFTKQEIIGMKLRDAVSFKPVIIKDGKPIKDLSFGLGVNPRTVIGQTKDKTIIVLVVDGRSIQSIGINLYQAQKILLDMGCVVAANLDGGSSTILVHEGKIINRPCSSDKARKIPTAFYIE